MSKRPQGAILLLLADVATEGLGLRDLVYKSCLSAIVDGHLAPGARVPSSRQLAADWHISRNTVDEAIARLQTEGFLVRRVGHGTFVAPKIPGRPSTPVVAKRRKPNALGRKALSGVSEWGRNASTTFTALGRSPYPEPFRAALPALDAFPLPLWRRLAARRWRLSGSSLLGYFPPLGHMPLREATVRHLATTRGVDCTAEQIVIVNSSMQAIDLIGRVLLEQGDSAWLEDPCFPNVRAPLAMSGARIVPVPVDEEGIDVDHGRRLAPGAALVFVTPSCQYPLGVTLSLERRLALLRFAERSGAWIVEDDYQSEFTYAGRPLAAIHSLDRGERTLYVGTFTNAVFPSLRLAYVVLPKSLVPVFQAIRRQLDDHTHGFMQAVLADFMDGGHFTAHLRKMRALYQSRRDALVTACARELPKYAKLGPTTGGMCASLHLPRRLVDREVSAQASAAGVGTFSLSRCEAGPRRHNGLTLGYTALTEQQIDDGVAQLARVIAGAGAK